MRPLPILLTVIAAHTAQAQVAFQALPVPSDLTACGINAVSPEGAYVVGHAAENDGGWRAVTFAPTFLHLPEPAGATSSDAVAVSANGHVIAATSNAPGYSGYLIIDGSITPIPQLPNTSTSIPVAISRDGSIIFGNCDEQMCRWTLVNGTPVPTAIPSPSPPYSSTLQACTTSGAIAAGRWIPELFADGHLISWSLQGGTQDLGVVSGASAGYVFTIHGISDDGSAMAVTKTQLVGVPLAMRWTSAGLVPLPRLPGTAGYSIVSGMTGDGSTMCGICDRIAVLWTTSGVQSLPAVLQSAGNDLTDWQTLGDNAENVAPRLSATGRTIAGVGRFLIGPGPSDIAYRPWIATFPTCGSADFNHDGDVGTDADIDSFFACLSGLCCAACESADFDGDGDIGTDADIDSFFRVLAGGGC